MGHVFSLKLDSHVWCAGVQVYNMYVVLELETGTLLYYLLYLVTGDGYGNGTGNVTGNE